MTIETRIMDLETEVRRLRLMIVEQGKYVRAASDSDQNVWKRIVKLISTETGVAASRILSSEKTHDVAEARQLAHFCAKVGLDWSCHRVGAAAMRDHGTIQNSVRMVTNRCDLDQKLSQTVKLIIERLRP